MSRKEQQFRLINAGWRSSLFSLGQRAVERAEGKPGAEIYLKALPLRNVEDVGRVKEDVAQRMIVILRVTPLAQKNVEELKQAVEELYEFATSIGGDIARLGEERIVITPPGVKIWRGLL